jgi:hypothetical protein
VRLLLVSSIVALYPGPYGSGVSDPFINNLKHLWAEGATIIAYSADTGAGILRNPVLEFLSRLLKYIA